MSFSDKLKTRKGQLIFVCSALGISWLFLLIYFGNSFFSSLPDAAKIKKAEKDLLKLREEYAKVNAAKKETDDVRNRYKALASRAWHTHHDGVVETQLRQRISAVAGETGFKLNNIGAVRTGRLNGEFYHAEIDLSGSGEIGDVIKFIAEIRKIEPVLSWRRLDLRPDRRFRMNTGVGSANLAARVNELPPTRLNFNGALRILGYDGKWSAKELGITRPDWREIARKSESRRRFPVMRAPDRRIGEKVPAAAAKPAANPAAGKADGGKK